MQYTRDRSRMPRRIVDWTQVHPVNYTKVHYILSWDTPNSEIGSCRVNPIQALECQNKSLVIEALKLAYDNLWVIRSFDDALEVIEGQGLRLMKCIPHGKPGRIQMTYEQVSRGIACLV